ncbi:epoxide hydrolase family protein [Streptomyces solisilvae]|uniref:epoxide hydrolase family protein n=1 Tax=Streptomyces malaysiensis TaxID=92644 RepID=UPI0036AD42EC
MATSPRFEQESDVEIRPFRIDIPDRDIDDLKRRLANTRWPYRETVEGWEQGVPLDKGRELADYWLNNYDWRRFEQRVNAFPQFTTRIDDLDIHFLHVRSKHQGAMPILLMHGWPGSIVEFIRLIEPLVDPVPYGGRPEDAFHVVLPSLPGWGFTEPPKVEGWGHERIARMVTTLMERLGYREWVAQGGDYGAHVLSTLGEHPPKSLVGIHFNLLFVIPRELAGDATAEEREAFEAWRWTQVEEGGFSHIQRTKPQTLGYGLVDSPIGQAMWIYEKFYRWTDNDGNPEDAIPIDDMLDNISLHWFTQSSILSARAFWEGRNSTTFDGSPIGVPVAATVFKNDIFKYPRSWAERRYSNLIYWNELEKGSHFGTLEAPDAMVREIRAAFSGLRGNGRSTENQLAG